MLQVHSVSSRFFGRAMALAPGGTEIREFLRLEGDGYSGGGTKAVPLGTRVGIPARAAEVDTAAVLEDFDPTAAEQCRNPDALLHSALPDDVNQRLSPAALPK